MIALHVLAAGVFAFVYARSRELDEVGSLVAAVGFMLSAKWMTHLLLAGHTITVGLAWLPLVLLGARTRDRGPAACGRCSARVRRSRCSVWERTRSGRSTRACSPSLWTLPAERSRLCRWLACWLGAVVVALC